MSEIVAELTVEQFKDIVQETVSQTLRKLLQDPDSGLELNPGFVSELESAKAQLEDGVPTFSTEEVAHSLGLDG